MIFTLILHIVPEHDAFQQGIGEKGLGPSHTS